MISGASSGIGAATAVACGAAGMGVVLMARREERLRAVAAHVERAGGSARVYVGDVSDVGDCEGAVSACVEAFGHVYGVFANAGYGFERSFVDTTDEELRAMMEVNFFGTANLVRAALPGMVERGAGHVLVCSSCLGKFSVPFYSAYCASKAAQWPLGHSIAGECGPRGVYATTVHPIGTRTEFFDEARKRAGGGGQVSDRTPGFLMQEPSFVAGCVVGALRRPRLEVWPGWTGRGMRVCAALMSLFPGVAHAVVRRMGRVEAGS